MLSSKNPLQLVFAKYRRLVSLLSVFCVLCGYALGQDWKTVHDGVEYAQIEKEISGLKVKMNLLRLDLTKVRLDVHHAMDAAIGTEKTSSIAMRHNAVAAINSGFFRLDKSAFAGDPAGLLIIDGILVSESSNNRCAFLIRNTPNSTQVDFGHLDSTTVIGLMVTDFVPALELSGINRERKNGETILYDSTFGKSTKTTKKGTDLVLRGCKIHIRSDQWSSAECRKVDILYDVNDTAIPAGGYVLSVDDAAFLGKSNGKDVIRNWNDSTARKRTVRLLWQIRYADTAPLFQRKNLDAVAGVPQLIKNGKIDITWEQEKASKSFVETRHPRTAVAKLKDGKFLMITIDGRSESSGGISLYDLADYLLSIGAVDAMNLDGGGSTTMFLDGKVVNIPSDKEGERKVADAIVVTLRKKSR